MSGDEGFEIDKRCVFCWEIIIIINCEQPPPQQSTSTTTDPRKLPCGQHICCRTCVEEYLRAHEGIILCPQCTTAHKCDNIEELPKVKHAMNEPISAQTCDGKGCVDELAVVYCSRCDERLCEEHRKEHETCNHSNEVVSIEAYERQAARDKIVYCDSHQANVLVKACTGCNRLVCIACVTAKEGCTDKSDTHKFVPIVDLSEETTALYRQLRKSADDRITELCRESKKTWQMLDEVEEKCVETIAEIDGLQEKPGCEPMGGRDALVAKVQQYGKEVTDEVLQFDSALMRKKQQIETLRNEMHRLVRDGHATEIVRQKKRITREMTKYLDEEIGSCRVRRPKLVYNDKPSQKDYF